MLRKIKLIKILKKIRWVGIFLLLFNEANLIVGKEVFGEKRPTVIKVLNKKGTYGKTVPLEGHLHWIDKYGNEHGLGDKEVKIYIDSKYIGSDESDGVGIDWEYEYFIDIAAGSHIIEAKFEGDKDYEASSGTGTLTVDKGDTKIINPKYSMLR
jgi:hypothetical protein